MAHAIKVGLYVTNQQPPGADMVTALNDQLQMVHAVRDAGWDSVFTGQHYLSEGMGQFQMVPFLTRLLGEIGDLEIGAGVLLLALQNPLDVAETWATIDVLSGGRLTFGVGLGYRDVEYDAFGVKGSTVRRFEENLAIIKQLWAGELVDADLPWCRLNGAALNVRPLQSPTPPIWIAADSDKGVERAARLSDTWLINPHATVETIESQIGLFDRARQDAGLPKAKTRPLMREVYCAPTREEALEQCGPYIAAKYQHYADWGQDKVLPGEETFRRPFDSLEASRFVIGSPESCIEQLLPWKHEFGVDYFIFRTDWIGMPVESALQSINLLSREVLPVLRAAGS